MTCSAWRLSAPGGTLSLDQIEFPEPRPGTALIRMRAVPLLSYLGAYVAGEMPYWYPPGPFTPGTNGIGLVEAVGPDVYHLKAGQRVMVHPHLVAGEITEEPSRILMGLTGISPDSGPMLSDWGNGTLAEKVLVPASTVVPLDGLEGLEDERLASLSKFVVPLGGLLRGRLSQGEILVVNGASGYFGSAAVLLGLALGSERVVAIGRSRQALDDLAHAAGTRVAPVALTGDREIDAKAIKVACGGRGAHLAFDQVGGASDPGSSLAALGSLRRGGRMVLMGSMTVPLPMNYGEIMVNDWEIIGNFMYRPEAFRTLLSLVRSGLLDLDFVRLTSFGFERLPEALGRAAGMRGLDCTVVKVAS